MKYGFFILFCLLSVQKVFSLSTGIHEAREADTSALIGNQPFTQPLPAPEDTTHIHVDICPGDSVVINGTTFNAAHPTGIEVIPGGSVNGMDSIISVELSILEPGEYFFTQTYCNNQFLLIGNHIYGPSNTVGEEILPGLASNGCDSLIHVNLTFVNAPEFDLEQTICEGDTIWVGNTPYHSSFYLGTEVLQGASYLGCDSTVNVKLTVVPKPVDTLAITICREDHIVLNGTQYDLQHPEGEEILENASVNGCDSTVVVRLSFHPTPPSFMGPDQSIAWGDTFCFHLSLPFVPDGIKWLTQQPCPDLPCFDFCMQAFHSQSFVLELNAPGDCILTDTLHLTVARGRQVFLPNVFRPGAGEPNDRFFVQTDRSVKRIQWLKVFDRWGESVFAVTDRLEIPYADGWDGRWKGTTAASGVYAYALQVEYLDGLTEIITGDVALIR